MMKYPILEKCTKCQKDLTNPKTLPCLHSFCSHCLNDVIKEQSPPPIVAKETQGSYQKNKKKSKEPTPAGSSSISTVIPNNLQCPQCHGGFEIPKSGVENLSADPFVHQLAKQKTDSTKIEDPNDVKCNCEDEDATVHCAICDLFIGKGCLKFHSKSRATANHATVPLNEYFSGNKSSKGKSVHHCSIHAGFVIDVFCKTCTLPMCLSCVLPDHKSHDCVKLTEMNLAFSDEIMKCLEPVQAREKKLRETILLGSKTIEELNQNAQSCIKGINQTFGIIQETLEKRKNELLSETEAVRFVKEKRLKVQREEMEFFAEGMRSSGEFAKGLVENGGQIEVALSKKAVMSRLTTLKNIPIETILHEDSTLRFGDGGKDEVFRVINGFGSVSGNQTSSKTSKIEWNSGSAPITSSTGTRSKSAALNERVSFKIISMNKEGERIKRGGDFYSVDLADNSKTQAEIVDHNDGSYSVSLVASVKGVHRVSVSFGGGDIQGSPFDLRVACVSAKTSYLEASKDLGLFPGLSEIEMKIVAVEEDGTPLKQGGENFTCSVTINDQPQAPPVISDLNNGTYQLKFTPATIGKCSVSVKLNGQEIKGSPLAFDVSTFDFFGGPKQFQVLYDAKVDGYSNAKFHQKCDNINGTVTLVILQNGAKFGGYNPGCWDQSGQYKTELNAFLFSVGSGPQKFALNGRSNQKAIYCGSDRGPHFGGGPDLYLNLDSLASSYSNPHTYSLLSNTTLAGSYNNWSFANVQVFRVI